MRIALYNQMFGLNGTNPISNLIGHWAVHFQNNEKKIWKRTNINWTIDIIRKSKAEIIGICEILEGQEKELKKKLKNIGYNYIMFGSGHQTKFRKLFIKVAIASKIKCNQVKVLGFPVRNEMGGGGGIIHCYFPTLKLNLINIHLASAKKKISFQQIRFLKKYIKKIKGKVILMGDFNLSYRELKSYFSNLELASEEINTCSVTPIIKWFSCKDLDHILIKGYKKDGMRELSGYSDHKLIYVDLK